MEITQLLQKIENIKENENLILKHIVHNESFLYLKHFENRHGANFAIVESNDGDIYHFSLSNLEIDKIIYKEFNKLNKSVVEEKSFERDI